MLPCYFSERVYITVKPWHLVIMLEIDASFWKLQNSLSHIFWQLWCHPGFPCIYTYSAHLLRLETHCCASPSMNNSLFLPLSSSPRHTHISTDSALHYDAIINPAINRALYSERHRDPRHMTWPSNSPANTGNIRRIMGRVCNKTALAHSYTQFTNLSKCMRSVEHTEKAGSCRESIR